MVTLVKEAVMLRFSADDQRLKVAEVINVPNVKLKYNKDYFAYVFVALRGVVPWRCARSEEAGARKHREERGGRLVGVLIVCIEGWHRFCVLVYGQRSGDFPHAGADLSSVWSVVSGRAQSRGQQLHLVLSGTHPRGLSFG